jgi:GT2 family glycosyltransferase
MSSVAVSALAGRVTVVVMTRDRWPDLQRSLQHHDVPVIVVDNGSTDDTPDHVRRDFPWVTLIELEQNAGVGARNIGVRQANTPYVAFADDDSWWEPGALARAVSVMDRHPRLAVLAGRMQVGEERRIDSVCELMADSPLGQDQDLPGPSILGFLACGVVVRREAFLSVGGFDELLFFAAEEEKLAMDLAADGWGLAYVDDVSARHHPSPVRDAGARRVQERRNNLLTAVMRRPWPVVSRVACEVLKEGHIGARAVLKALPVLSEALRRREVLPAPAEHARRVLEQQLERPNTAEVSDSNISAEGRR